MADLDFNDAEPQRAGDLIPNGTIAPVVGIIRPGQRSRPGMEAADAGWLTPSNSSDVLYLSWEFTITEGPHRNRKFWQNMTVSGGAVNEKGESKAWHITKSQIRAMINSARGIKPDDDSEKAQTARRINSWGDLSPIEFIAKIGIQKAKPDSGYPDQNRLAVVIEPDHKEYASPPGGHSVSAPAPSAAPSSAPAWGQRPPQQQQAPAAAGKPVPAWAR